MQSVSCTCLFCNSILPKKLLHLHICAPLSLKRPLHHSLSFLPLTFLVGSTVLGDQVRYRLLIIATSITARVPTDGHEDWKKEKHSPEVALSFYIRCGSDRLVEGLILLFLFFFMEEGLQLLAYGRKNIACMSAYEAISGLLRTLPTEKFPW